MATADLITRKEILEATGFEPSAYSRMMERPEIRRWLGGEKTHPSYPRENLDLFLYMYEQSQKGIKPGAFAIVVSEVEPGEIPGGSAGLVMRASDVERSENASSLNGLSPSASGLPIPFSGDAIASAGHQAGLAFVDVVIERLAASRILPPVEDRFLTRAQAAELLACKPGAVGRLVRPVRAETWSFLDIQQYMAQLRQAAHDKPRPERKTRRLSAVSNAE